MIALSPAPAMASSGWRITAYKSGRCIAPVNNNTTDRNVAVVLSNAPCGITWSIIDRPGDLYYKTIRLDANSARCLVPSGGSIADGVKLLTGACFDTGAFWWRPLYINTYNGLDYYQWKNENSRDCMAADYPGLDAGTPIVQQPCNTLDSTQWWTW